jgi:peptidyl-prolyl cis-trans isomerase A (cyclophilin A)
MFVQRYRDRFGVAVLAFATAGCLGGGTPPTTDPAIPRVDAEPSDPVAPEKKAPEEYWVKLDTTKGPILIECHRAWSPYGADRFYELVSNGFYDDNRIFRVISGYVIQMGINGDPNVNAKWRLKRIPDDKLKRGDPRQPNARGYVTFAKSQIPDSRTTQFFINCKDNFSLDSMGFTAFGKVVDGMAAVDSMYEGYGAEPMRVVPQFELEGNAYLDKAFPKLDSIKKATILSKAPDLPKPKAG